MSVAPLLTSCSQVDWFTHQGIPTHPPPSILRMSGIYQFTHLLSVDSNSRMYSMTASLQPSMCVHLP
jgi:hypothetical protein